jgi:hypothetical protein
MSPQNKGAFSMAKIPSSVSHFHVYSYEHVDELSFVRSARKVDRSSPYAGGLEMLQPDIERLFRAHGWEGDGEVGLVWLPPFVGDWGSGGLLVWFVKQSNNGTSFLASEEPLPFPHLNDGGDEDEDGAVDPEEDRFKGLTPEGLVHVSREGLEEQLDEIVPALGQDLAAIALVANTTNVAAHLIERAQGQMVQALMSFLDDCYLRVLIDVIRDGNKSGVKLRKSRASVDPSDYVPDELDGDAAGYFTLSGFISDLWAAYKFEPFQKKIEMLLKPIDFMPDQNLMFELRKHVALRNAVQHHEGWLGDLLLSVVKVLGQIGKRERYIARHANAEMPPGSGFCRERTGRVDVSAP